MSEGFPDFIMSLPEPDSPVDMTAHIAPSEYCLPMFYEIESDTTIPEHAHGAQWGVVLAGSMDMTIGGETRTYARGDTYFVPPGILHVTAIKGPYRGIDVFADPTRYLPRDAP